MAGPITHSLFDDTVEILPPERAAGRGGGKMACLCCQRERQSMDDDGCGICDDCLRP
ncbi:hypothetical protein P7F60_16970 [Rhizobium sp. YJ-22]|uniref:hypothetical protein n=1 Tax=Rhizobium sp. YJ-22 TaxID=3037556 RepID=UPI002412BD01|nr:hypothetical protein [Rhizobium sp. YJ-22]MDG3578090.1 hypothetical protein [Rhizobium sp. YJ-22]